MKKIAKNIVDTGILLSNKNLNRGSSGNFSVRDQNRPDFLIITPSGVPYQKMSIKDLVTIDLTGKVIDRNTHNHLKPSSEWRFHCDIYRQREEINSIVHTHSSYASAVAARGINLPAFNYMIAIAGGDNIRCAKYAIFGSQQLSNNAIKALENRQACLLANHGLIALGKDLSEAVLIAEEVEELCKQYVISQQLGKPKILSNAQMNQVIKKFKDYRQSVK